MDFNFRTLNYLGSKLRLLDFIEEYIRRITPENGSVCDLFAGSGCVSYRLSRYFNVISCDIQAYSNVICNALLNNHDIVENDVNSFIFSIKNKSSKLKESFLPLILTEYNAIKNKDIKTLAEILEHGSVEVFRIESVQSSLSEIQEQVRRSLENNNLMHNPSIISRYYGGVYFSYEQAVDIDIIWNAIREINDMTKKHLYLSALLSTVSDIVNTVGKHFAQPIKAKDSKGNIKALVYNKAIKDKTMQVLPLFEQWLKKYILLPKSKFNHVSMQGDFMDCLNTLPDSVNTIYADPPYTRDHYSRFYHVLETIALDDEPEISTVKIHGVTRISNGIYRKDRFQSPFCIKSQAPIAFVNMFKVIADSKRNLLLSYSPYDETKKTHPRVVTLSQLVSWASEYFTNVEVVSAGHFTHNKLNSVSHLLEASDEAEVLIVCTN